MLLELRSQFHETIVFYRMDETVLIVFVVSPFSGEVVDAGFALTQRVGFSPLSLPTFMTRPRRKY